MRGRPNCYSLVVAALVTCSACAQRSEVPSASAGTARTSRGPAVQAPRTAPITPGNYVTSAASIDLFVIRSSELALERSQSQRVRDMARTLIQAHKGTSSQLSLAGRRLNQLPSAQLLLRHELMLSGLTAARDFDRAYRESERAVHEEGLALHRDFAIRGQSPTLRPVATAAAAVFQRQLRLLNMM